MCSMFILFLWSLQGICYRSPSKAGCQAAQAFDLSWYDQSYVGLRQQSTKIPLGLLAQHLQDTYHSSRRWKRFLALEDFINDFKKVSTNQSSSQDTNMKYLLSAEKQILSVWSFWTRCSFVFSSQYSSSLDISF